MGIQQRAKNQATKKENKIKMNRKNTYNYGSREETRIGEQSGELEDLDLKLSMAFFNGGTGTPGLTFFTRWSQSYNTTENEETSEN